MGGVDLHDAHCSKLLPPIRSKKWTWAILMRLIQSSLTNATVLLNLTNLEKKVSAKDFALAVCNTYLEKSKTKEMILHTAKAEELKRSSVNKKCAIRTNKFCIDCNQYQCKTCFKNLHK